MREAPPSVDIAKKLRALEVFAGADDRLIESVARGLTFQRVNAGETVFQMGEPAACCYVISYGSLKLIRPTAQGKEVVIRFCQVGDFVAAAVMANPSPRFPLSAIALEDSALLRIPRQQYLDVWQANPMVARAMNLNIMGRLMEFQTDKTMSVASVPQKIASFILRTLDQQPQTFGNRIHLKLTRRDIADRVGTTVETVIRTLSQWTQNGWIQSDGSHLVVLNRDALESLLKGV